MQMSQEAFWLWCQVPAPHLIYFELQLHTLFLEVDFWHCFYIFFLFNEPNLYLIKHQGHSYMSFLTIPSYLTLFFSFFNYLIFYSSVHFVSFFFAFLVSFDEMWSNIGLTFRHWIFLLQYSFNWNKTTVAFLKFFKSIFLLEHSLKEEHFLHVKHHSTLLSRIRASPFFFSP